MIMKSMYFSAVNMLLYFLWELNSYLIIIVALLFNSLISYFSSRFKRVSTQFRGLENSRAVRAATQKDERKHQRSRVVQNRRNIPDCFSPFATPQPSQSSVTNHDSVQTTKKEKPSVDERRSVCF